MKHFLFSFLLILTLPTTIAQTQTIESDIHSSYNYIYQHATMCKIDSIIGELEKQAAGKDNRYLTYWLAYARYERAIASLEYYNYNREKYASLKDVGLSLLEQSIKETEAIHEKTSEDYALLAIMKNASLPFCNALRVPFLSREVKKYASMAVEMDNLNLRGWLALAILDRYTPERYGGGKRFEELFLRVIALKDKSSDFPYDPSWGKDEAYIHLISYYKGSNPSKAASLLDEAIQLYPDNHRLQALQKNR